MSAKGLAENAPSHVPARPRSRGRREGFSSEERVLLENLAQFYCYDFSEVLEMYVDEDARFGDIDFTPYWVDEWRHSCPGSTTGSPWSH